MIVKGVLGRLGTALVSIHGGKLAGPQGYILLSVAVSSSPGESSGMTTK